MEHPNIAKIFEAGATETGRPYFVMELVRGAKITDYCDEHKLSTAERLNLFLQVCRAVQHAHQKGIIHRDIKPSNILVTSEDGPPVPKIIDFGVAKATGPSLTQRTLYTALEQIIGTPAYMSPEQAERGGLDIDTRSDIYSLGVLLYELLTGCTPFDSQELLRAGVEAMRRKIREEEPPRPSTRLTSLTNEELTSVALRRRAEPPKLITLVRGDLDWIVMKALEKERSRRYETANGLASDIQRSLNNEPILARPPSNLYRFQKLVRRNKLPFAAASIVFLSLALGLAASIWQAARATSASRIASANEQKAQRVTGFLTGMFESIDPASAKQKEVTVREILDEAGRTIETSFSNEPLSEVTMRGILADVYSKLGRDQQALPHAEAALRLTDRMAGGKDDAEVAGALNSVARRLDGLGRSADALPRYEAALAMRRRLYPGDNAQVSESLNNLALCLNNLGRPAEALPKYVATLEMNQRLYRTNDPHIADSLNNLAFSLQSSGHNTEALTNYQAALRIYQQLYQGDHPALARCLGNMATCLGDLGRSAEALPLHQEVLEMRRRIYREDHPDVATAFNNLAAALNAVGRPSAALSNYQAALDMSQRIYKSKHPSIARGLGNIGYCLDALGRPSEALTNFQAALAMWQELFPRDHPLVATGLNNVAACFDELGFMEQALTNYEAAVLMLRRIYKGDHFGIATTLNNEAFCLTWLGRPAEALPKYEEALNMYHRLYKADSAVLAQALRNFAICLEVLVRTDAALQKYNESRAMLERLTTAQPSNNLVRIRLAKVLEYVANLKTRTGQREEAVADEKQALELVEKVLAGTPEHKQANQLRLSLRAALGVEQDEVVVLAIIPDSHAQKAALQPGDAVLTFAGEQIFDADQLMTLAARTKGEQIELAVRRDAKPMKVLVSQGPLGIRCENRPLSK
jgi:serine/threonine protein kinase